MDRNVNEHACLFIHHANLFFELNGDGRYDGIGVLKLHEAECLVASQIHDTHIDIHTYLAHTHIH
jgi:hypothetical protein